MQQTKPHIFKWIIIGALGTMGIFVIFIFILLYMFTPLIQVDEGTGRIRLFGGTVDVQARDVITKLSKEGSFVFGEIDGVQKLAAEVTDVEVKFSSGEIRIDYNQTDEMNWDCDGAGKSSKFEMEQNRAILDFTGAFVDCDISIPAKPLKISGVKGEVEVRKVQAPLDIMLPAGDVFIQPVAELAYNYTLEVTEGEVSDTFVSSPDPNAIKIKVDVKLGNISPLDQ